ncbi:cupin domain-containing protein [Taibaiella koreensis]|uniref:cupin domain-containing protein n=1 Tax=Taibaiella koreensis TaxID=1268548 RepID=UPI000E59C930|nr:cupin domain-containing protein [Taibaiella koreensis]
MQTTKDYLNDQLKDKTVVFLPGEGEAIAINGNKITLKVTSDLSNDQLGVYEILLQPGTIGARLHYHRFMDETFIVNKGTLTVSLEDREITVPEGGLVFIPRMSPHGFRNDSAAAVTVTLLFHPGQQREGFFYGLKAILEEEPVDPAKYLKLYQKYDSFPLDVDQMLPLPDPAAKPQ